MNKIRYRLLTGAMLVAASQAASAITITVDYSFDTNNFFANSSRRTVMDAAASYFEARLTDDLLAITSSANYSTMTAKFFDPASTTDAIKEIPDFSVAADTITVYAGGSSMGTGGTLAWGGFGWHSAYGSQAFLDTVEQRGEGVVRGTTATEFSLWGGSISFNSNSSWYFDDDLTTNEGFTGSDFYSVALHELGHVLGLGTADSWDNLINGSHEFTGANAVASYGDNVPLAAGDNGHWDYGTMSYVDGVPQEASMDPNLTTGTRKRFTDLDMAALDDIGWDVAPVPLPPALLLFASGILGLLGLRKNQQKHA
jgi:Matrixin